ncbi:MAG: M48 family metallopeptidase [Candidatus Lernaella stagnicola]|nr:M48 family metallopeptidase [Candidatus Lernaella stagnicola]
MADVRPRVMNFFDHQERARKRTIWLLLLFLLAVALIVVAVYFLTMFVFFMSDTSDQAELVPWWDPVVFAIVAAAVIGLVALASLYKTTSLRGGGEKVAEMLGGRRVPQNTTNRHERRLLNVVEEMAIAAGTPVPPAYVLDDEAGINAFAAGHSPNDAVVAVTRGTLEQLNREELQGVIGHEFSHILNGDMRLNIKLIGIVFGILVLGIIGVHMLHSMRFSRRNKGAGAIMLLGLGLLLIGYIGTFIGRVIQAAVSRQREFLADASSVQFTRNPDGIAGALKKIGGIGSAIETPEARQASHMFFGEDRKPWLSFILATHPPLADRISRIDADFKAMDAKPAAASSGPTAGFEAAVSGFGPGAPTAVKPEDIVTQVGTVREAQVAIAVALVRGIPTDLRSQCETPRGAQQVIFALLLDDDADEREKQLRILTKAEDEKFSRDVAARHLQTADLSKAQRLPLADLALPALRELDVPALSSFTHTLEQLVMADGKLALNEFSLHWLVTHRLSQAKGGAPSMSYRSLKPLRNEVAALLRAIAQAGQADDPPAAEVAFAKGAARLANFPLATPEFAVGAGFDFGALGTALMRLSRAFPKVKETVLDAAAHCALADEKITMQEAELLRLISFSLDCPLPPFATATLN